MTLMVNKTLILCTTKSNNNKNTSIQNVMHREEKRHIQISEKLKYKNMGDLELIKYGSFYHKTSHLIYLRS